ncbi:MAG: DUF1700 domain-containing protein [Clostridia bacterium]|nr:DUF1700 domain-containing protein [Clostridia bacterium]
MTKREFFADLRARLSGLSEADVRKSLDFYEEMIADRMEEGMGEEEAVAAIGTPAEIAERILSEMPLTAGTVKKSTRCEGGLRSPWVILLLVLGSPVWLSLLIAVFAVILSLCAVGLAVFASLWAVFGSFVACAVGGVLGGAYFIGIGSGLPGVAMIGAALLCAGLAILSFCGALVATKGVLWLVGQIGLGLTGCFAKKEVEG